MSNGNHIWKIIRKLIQAKIRRTQRSHINKLLACAKVNEFYHRYPFNDFPPVMANYSFWRKSDTLWLDFFYSVYQKPDAGFISVPVYDYIETCLNHRMLTYAIKDKNFYNLFMNNYPTPKTLLRKINGLYYNQDYKMVDENQVAALIGDMRKVLLKPSVESGGGGSILLFERVKDDLINEGGKLNIVFLKGYQKDFVLQEYVIQHEFFSQFNPSSNNTIRVFVYRSITDDSINILHCLLRVGAKGSYLDHDHLGGVVMAVDDNNNLSTYAIDLYGKKYEAVNNITISSLGEVPFIDEIKKMAIQIAGEIYYGRLLALDFTVNSEGKVMLLEVNCWGNGISQYQMHNGSLFRGFTKEILDYCNNCTTKVFVLQSKQH